MALRDVAGIFSRAFVVGHFIPTLGTLVIVDQSVDYRSLPHAYNQLDAGNQLLVLGGVALALGLLLWGLHYPILRLFQGYALEAASKAEYPNVRLWPTRVRCGGWHLKPFPWLYTRAIERQQRRFEPIASVAAQTERSPERSAAAKELGRAWPPTAADLLPTRLGNTIRSFEWHPRQRYNLNGIYAYPRIATMLNDAEREIVTEARTDLAFFLNIAFLTVLAGVYVLADSLWHGWWKSFDLVPALLLPPLIFVAATRAAIGAADRWGAAVRTSFDMHRLELYEAIGLRRPATQEEEHQVANALNRLLVYARPLPNELRALPEPAVNKEEHENG